MKIRLAKPHDASQLAALHQLCALDQPGSFMAKIGHNFLREYYKLTLNAPWTVVLCAENSQGQIIGLVSGSFAIEKQMTLLRHNKLRLAIAALPAILQDPNLIFEMYARQRPNSGSEGYIVTEGPREEYWAWHPSERSSGGAIELHRKWLYIMSMLGATYVRLEVDRVNINVEKMHKLMGAKVVKEFETPDGKKRLIMEYTFFE